MKYEIEVIIGTVTDENMDIIKTLLFGDPFEVFYTIEGGELISNKKMAIEEFKQCSATARRQDDGTIEIRIPQLIRGKEELDEDYLEETGEKTYYLSEYSIIDKAEFDEESLQLFQELGFTK